MNVNPLKTLDTFGQSLWLDYIRRDLITNGQFRRLIEQDGLQGMVWTPCCRRRIFNPSAMIWPASDERIAAQADSTGWRNVRRYGDFPDHFCDLWRRG
jgi:hypothetical protein